MIKVHPNTIIDLKDLHYVYNAVASFVLPSAYYNKIKGTTTSLVMSVYLQSNLSVNLNTRVRSFK